jgi:uncharacterized membrane protein HdeD (DUF308 family)
MVKNKATAELEPSDRRRELLDQYGWLLFFRETVRIAFLVAVVGFIAGLVGVLLLVFSLQVRFIAPWSQILSTVLVIPLYLLHKKLSKRLSEVRTQIIAG